MSGGTRPTLVTVDTFRADAMFPKVERAVLAILASGKVVTPVDVMVRIGWLSQEDLDAWRQGRVPYLEAVVQCNLTRLSRFLRILRFCCHDLNLTGKLGGPPMRTGRKALALRFTKTGDPRIEAAYARRYVWPGKGPFHLPRRPPPRGAGVPEAGGFPERSPLDAPQRTERNP